MAEAVAVIGAVGAICNITDTIFKVISLTLAFKNEWREAETKILSLVSQLGALKSAFLRIEEICNNPSHLLRPQEVEDMELCISCCEALVGRLWSQISNARPEFEGTLDKASRFRMVFSSRSIDETEKILGRQTCALNLLLSAINCQWNEGRSAMLQSEAAVKLRSSIKNDSESLIVLRDADLIITGTTDNGSKLSMVFQFDGSLMKSKVYERALRASMFANLRQNKARAQRSNSQIRLRRQSPPSSQDHLPDLTNFVAQGLESTIHEMPPYLYRLFCLGLGDSGKTIFTRQLERLHGSGFGQEVRLAYRGTVISTTRKYCEMLADYVRNCYPHWWDSNLLKALLRPGDSSSNSDLVKDVLSISKHPAIESILHTMCMDFPDFDRSGQYFCKHVRRIFRPDYVPSETDLLHLYEFVTTKDLTKHIVSLPRLPFHVEISDYCETENPTDLVSGTGERPSIIVFVVDVASYNLPRTDLDYGRYFLFEENRLRQNLQEVKSLFDFETTADVPIVLILNNFKGLVSKLSDYPLSKFIGAETGINAQDAVQFVKSLFDELSSNRSGVTTFCAEIADEDDIHGIVEIIQHTIKASGVEALPPSPARAKIRRPIAKAPVLKATRYTVYQDEATSIPDLPSPRVIYVTKTCGVTSAPRHTDR